MKLFIPIVFFLVFFFILHTETAYAAIGKAYGNTRTVFFAKNRVKIKKYIPAYETSTRNPSQTIPIKTANIFLANLIQDTMTTDNLLSGVSFVIGKNMSLRWVSGVRNCKNQIHYSKNKCFLIQHLHQKTKIKTL